MSGTDLPPPYHALKEGGTYPEASTEQNGGTTAHASSDLGSGAACPSTVAGVPLGAAAAAAGPPPRQTSAPAAELPQDKEPPQATVVPPGSEESHDAPKVYSPSFEDKDSRMGFIQKVLAIKLFQAFAMTLVMVFFVARRYSTYRKPVYQSLIVVSSLIFIAILGLLHYCNKSRFIMPFNYIFLAAYPLSVGFFISVVTFYCGFIAVFVSWVYFNFILFGLLMYSIFAMKTSIEFSNRIGHIISGGIVIVGYSITLPFIHLGVFGILYCSLTNSALTAYILSDLQEMMSKTYHTLLTPEDFVKAALIMHIDYRYLIMKFYNKHFNATQRNDNVV